MDKKKILIIDDEFYFCKLVKLNLELTGEFVVYVANNGKQGISLARKVKPDIILLDIIMPGMTGFEVLEKLKKDKKTMEITVAMLTAKEDEGSKISAARLYSEEYIVKTQEIGTLRAAINDILKRKGII
ncbi:MAG: response regulator [Candidatus Omnitrophica bacterium]|nr:response regulator [Candidatus Omnitrophota bacterium]